MRTQLSILIPTFNTVCVTLVRTLAAQAAGIEGLDYEIIVVDDGSTDAETVVDNDEISTLPHCRYIKNETNIGRSAIRNRLGKEAKNEWFLFIDSGVEVESEKFLNIYLNAKEDSHVIVGGIATSKKNFDNTLNGNLRYRYELASEPQHSASERAKCPYQSFRTSNFMVRKDVFDRIKFDETISTYGYEDVLFGKALHDNGITIEHIDNTVVYTKYDENTAYITKTEEAMHTLSTLYEQLQAYSKIISAYQKLHHLGLDKFVFALFYYRKRAWRNNLCSAKPSLLLFKLYKLGYFIEVQKRP